MAKKVFNFGERLALYDDLPTNVSELTNDAGYTTSQDVQTLIDANTIQYSTMPTASVNNLGNIVQYTGITDSTYTNGYFYVCISDGQETPTYSWSQLNIQPAPDMSNYEQILNKVTSVTSSATDIQYPSAKAVWDLIKDSGVNMKIHWFPSSSSYKYYINLEEWEPGFYALTSYQQTNSTGTLIIRRNSSSTLANSCQMPFNLRSEFWPMFLCLRQKIKPGEYYSTNQDLGFFIGVANNTAFNQGKIVLYPLTLQNNTTIPAWNLNNINSYLASGQLITRLPQEIFGVKTFNSLPKGIYNNNVITPTVDGELTPKKYVDDQDKIILNNIAPQYSTSSTYNEGDHVIYNGVLYECNTTISVAEAWTPAHWTQKEILSYIDNKISNIDTTKREIVQTLPTQDIATDTIYMVPKTTPSTQNVYDEYMYINSAWEIIGSTEVDLTNYYTKSEVDAMITNLNNQIGNISAVLAQLVNTVVPIDTTLYTENITVGGNTGTYTVVAKEHHIDTDYYVLEYTFENTSNNTIEGLMLDEIYDDGVNPAQHVPLLWVDDIEPGETVVLTQFWQDPATYQASLNKYDDDQNITLEYDEADNATTFTQNLPLANLGFNTDVVAHTTAYNSNDVTGGFTCTTFDRTGGSEDPYTVPEEFQVVWINQNNQTFGVLSEPVNGSLTMTRSYHGFDAAQLDSTYTQFFLAKTADIANCTYQEFLAAYNAFVNGGGTWQ